MKSQKVYAKRVIKSDKINHVANNIMLITALVVVGLLIVNAIIGIF